MTTLVSQLVAHEAATGMRQLGGQPDHAAIEVSETVLGDAFTAFVKVRRIDFAKGGDMAYEFSDVDYRGLDKGFGRVEADRGPGDADRAAVGPARKRESRTLKIHGMAAGCGPPSVHDSEAIVWRVCTAQHLSDFPDEPLAFSDAKALPFCRAAD